MPVGVVAVPTCPREFMIVLGIASVNICIIEKNVRNKERIDRK